MKSLKTKKIARWLLLACLLLAIAFYFCLPSPLFNDPASTIIEDRNGALLAAKIAADGQWRFPERKSVPEKFRQSIIYFEDEYFDRHKGVNPVSMLRAFKQNWKAGKVVSGGSTISMQVIRLSRKGKSRTVFEKLLEIILATRMEIRYSKEEILALYASHAPFGGNVVGLDAASWRYYGREPEKLSWGETATLAVLPNAPALIYPGKNHEKLLAKRNTLLEKLKEKGVMDEETCALAKSEPLPETPLPLPQSTPHLLTRLVKEGSTGKKVVTGIDASLQKKANAIADKYHKALAQNDIHNIAILVMKVETGEVLAYVGNSPCEHEESGADVDIITAPRSTGSILKPLLYATMLDDGEILPNTLVADIPTHISGYTPKNFDKTYDGAVPASNALTRSLNIPSVRLLRQYGLERFHDKLQKLNFSTIHQPADHYGLSLILGGAEATLWDLVSVYGSMARSLNHFSAYSSKYFPDDYREASLLKVFIPSPDRGSPSEGNKGSLFSPLQGEMSAGQRGFHLRTPKWLELKDHSIFSAASVWETFETLSNVNRPREERGWEFFASSRKVAWKTGTSFGHRDAWAIGITPEYVVGVWVGNADGEGRPGLTGSVVAGPVLFDVFKNLPSTTWFEPPYDEMVLTPVCSKSGFRASLFCTDADSLWIPKNGLRTNACPFHQMVHLDKEMKHRVSSECYPVADMQSQHWFVLPPIQEWYYKTKDPNYQSLPPVAQGCIAVDRNMEIIYPESNCTRIFIPRLMDGTFSKTVFEATHRTTGMTVYWHVDDEYTGSTRGTHKMELMPREGKHKLTLVDENGEEVTQWFEMVDGALGFK